MKHIKAAEHAYLCCYLNSEFMLTSVLITVPFFTQNIWGLKLLCTQYPKHCLVAELYPTLCDPMGCRLPGSSVHEDFPCNNSGVDCHFLLQMIFPTQSSNPYLLKVHWSWIRKSKFKSSHHHYLYQLWQVTASINCIFLIGILGIVIWCVLSIR